VTALSRQVYSYRLRQMRALMQVWRYDALAFTMADWFEWASNHEPREYAWERPFLLIVPMEGPSIAFLSEQSRHLADLEATHGSLWADLRIHYAESNCEGHEHWQTPQWAMMVAETLTEQKLQQARIGVDSPSAAVAEVQKLLPGLKLQPCGPSLRALRRIKHSEELETMRAAAALSDWAMAACREEIKPGQLLAELDYRISERLAVEAARRVPGENYVIGRLRTLSGPTSACPHGDDRPTGRRVEPNSIAITTVVTRLNGLAMELARPFLVGKPPGEAIELFDCVSGAQDAALEAAAPGLPVSGIQRAAERVFERTRWADLFRLRAGHGIGVALHDFPHDMAFEGRPLEKDETYAIEPGIYLPHLGAMRFADTVVIGTGGAEQLTRAPKDRRSLSIN
jgi:Xaa-Pro aminopeptidase